MELKRVAQTFVFRESVYFELPYDTPSDSMARDGGGGGGGGGQAN